MKSKKFIEQIIVNSDFYERFKEIMFEKHRFKID